MVILYHLLHDKIILILIFKNQIQKENFHLYFKYLLLNILLFLFYLKFLLKKFFVNQKFFYLFIINKLITLYTLFP